MEGRWENPNARTFVYICRIQDHALFEELVSVSTMHNASLTIKWIVIGPVPPGWATSLKTTRFPPAASVHCENQPVPQLLIQLILMKRKKYIYKRNWSIFVGWSQLLVSSHIFNQTQAIGDYGTWYAPIATRLTQAASNRPISAPVRPYAQWRHVCAAHSSVWHIICSRALNVENFSIVAPLLCNTRRIYLQHLPK